ncbi:MAG TPA: M23 family metallopeptidase [Hyphomonas sp.]|nr:M23 family metallopeptidase [Hyphomonas sp.]
MGRKHAGKPARVDRRLARTHAAEWVAATSVIAGMAALFLLVQPVPAPPEPVLATALVDLRSEQPSRPMLERTGQVTHGADAIDVLEVLGASRDEAGAALDALHASGLIDHKRLPAGTLLTAFFDESGPPGHARPLISVSLRPDPVASVMAVRQPDGRFEATKLNARIFLRPRFASGTILSTLPAAIRLNGGSIEQANQFTATFPTQRPDRIAQPGDSYELAFEAREDERGNFLGMNKLLYAGFGGPAGTRRWYRFTPADTGVEDFYRSDGISYTSLLTRFPIGRVRINSGFGPRLHPVSGRPHLHKGVDFHAPAGSEVLAAGDGEIDAMAWGDGYGRFIRIRHDDGYETVYAHLSGYVAGLRQGQKVHRGEVIGYVGDTGTTTGPHLHYEIRREGRALDPMSLYIPPARNLTDTPDIMQAFRRQMTAIDALHGTTKSAQFTTGIAPTLISQQP